MPAGWRTKSAHVVRSAQTLRRTLTLKLTPSPDPYPFPREHASLNHLQELFRHRELIYNLVVRDLKGRYKGSAMGFLWTLLNPLGMMVVFTIVFTIMMPNNQLPHYPLFLLAGLLPWNFFSSGTMIGTNSVVANSALVKKVYFPLEVLPASSVLASLVNFLLALVVLFGVLLLFRTPITAWILMLPLVILIQTCFTLGVAMFLSTLNVFYRDTLIVLDVVMQAWFFLTPIFYPIEILPRSYQVMGITLDIRRLVYILNPMASIVAAYRDLLYWGAHTDLAFLSRTAATALLVLIIGYWFSVRYSGQFGEEL
jgi:lipopolysaccharide transport system permease protein